MLKIAILGDFVQTPGFAIDKNLQELLQQTDFNIANFEAPFIDPSMKPANGRFGLYQKLPDAELLKKLNIKVVSLANNHISDFQVEGFRLTKKILDDHQILYFGAGETLEEAETPAVLQCNNHTVSFRGAMSRYLTRFHAGEQEFGTADIRADRLVKALKEDDANLKIVYNHWNQEYEDYPEPIYKEDAEAIIKHAHVIAGSHSHCIQGVELYKGRPIFYGLGNFSLPNIDYYGCRISSYRPKCYHSFFPVIKFDGEHIEYDIHPFIIDPNGAVLSTPSGDMAKKILSRIDQISKPLSFTNREYYRYYVKHRDRKMRKPLTRNHLRNSMNLKGYRVKYTVVHGVESALAKILDKMGLRSAVRKRFKKVIDNVQKAK